MKIFGTGATPPSEGNNSRRMEKTEGNEASIFKEMFKDGKVTAEEQAQYAYDVISKNEDLISKIKNCGKDLGELIKKYSWPIKNELKNIKDKEEFYTISIKGSVSIIQHNIENEIRAINQTENIDKKENQKPEQGEGFWFQSENIIDHLKYVKDNLKSLGRIPTDDEIIDVVVEIMTITDFDDYNFNTSMLKKHKFCNKDTNGNYIETHFLDYVVNACKIKLDNKPHDNK